MKSDELPWNEDGWHNSLSRPTKVPPPVIYHYCSVDAFVEIVTNKTLWLTNLFFLNDSEEHFWFRNRARRFIEKQMQEHPNEFGYEYLETILRQGWRHEIYCACFSEQPDLLSQWRAYGDDGKGCAIGFATEHLQWLCTNLQGMFTDVIYDDTEQDSLVENVFDLPPRLCDGEDPTIEEGSSTILGQISEAASRCKSKAFSEEAEWRLVCEPILTFAPNEENCWTKATMPRYIERRGMITPYIEVPLVEGKSFRKRGIEPIKEVYFGPKNSATEQEYAATSMLKAGGFGRVRIVRSSVTYR
ncbi:MAG: DUF2971 domain-containing protein [Pirellulaceae bacterium]